MQDTDADEIPSYLKESNGIVSIELVGKTQNIISGRSVKSCKYFAECNMDSFSVPTLII